MTPRPAPKPPAPDSHPLLVHMAEEGRAPAVFQRAAWAAYARGESGLIAAPTGSGKTLAAWGGPLLAADPRQGGKGLKVLWLTPLKALAADTSKALQRWADEAFSGWTVEARSGDTGASVRARQAKRPPDALVTTPESLSLMLSYADLAPRWAGLDAVIVDEWHELIGTRRGVQVELALSVLRHHAPGLRVWGLSATLGNLTEAASVLLGPGRRASVIEPAGDAESRRRLDVETLIPTPVDRFSWRGQAGLKWLPGLVERIDAARTTLIFTNTRAAAERWYDALATARPDWPIALHHGSLSSPQRQATEAALKHGTVKAVVATSSLDLGVDFGAVEQVVQIGGPKAISRLLQRAGRSNHRPGETPRAICAPVHSLELAEFGAVKLALDHNRLEARRPLVGPLDVLAQHVVTMALTARWTAEALRDTLAHTHAYQYLTDADWAWTLAFVATGGPALVAYPQFHKVVTNDEGLLTVPDATLARRHRMAVGTIVSEARMRVRFVGGGGLGEVEESFISRLNPGDSFLFTGRRLTLVRVHEMEAQVRLGGSADGPPRFSGARLSISDTLSASLLELIHATGKNAPPNDEARALMPLLDVQRRWSGLPGPTGLLAERTKTREGEHLFVFPFAGRAAHEALAALLAWRLSRLKPSTFAVSFNDYGLELLGAWMPELDGEMMRSLLGVTGLEDDLAQAVNASEMAKRRFREIARVAGMVFEGYPGGARKNMRQVQMSSGLLYDTLVRFDPGHKLLAQARRDAFDTDLDLPRLRARLERMAGETITLARPRRLTPLAFGLWAERTSLRLSSEDAATRVLRMLGRLEEAADHASQAR